MSITSVNQTSSGIAPANQSEQDSYEKNIQKQITKLRQEIKDIAYDREKSSEEKTSEKKTLQERIQNLNSELKKHQLQKKAEEAAKKRESAAQSRESSAQVEEREQGKEERTNISAEEIKPGISAPEAGVIISISNTKEQVLCMKKVRTGLEGRMRTADTEQEKLKLQERINNVSDSMGEKVKKIADKIAENQRTEQGRKDKVYEIQQEQKREQEERRAAMNVVIPDAKKDKTADADRRKENFVITGKVSIT